MKKGDPKKVIRKLRRQKYTKAHFCYVKEFVDIVFGRERYNDAIEDAIKIIKQEFQIK